MKTSRSVISVLCFSILAILTSCAPPVAAPTTAPRSPTALRATATTVPATATAVPATATEAPAATAAGTAAATAPVTSGTGLQGDPVRGGKLYDTWWTEIGQKPPQADNPLWKTQTTNTRTGSSTWRCAECHGWDYKGVDGVFATGSHQTGFKGILADKGKPAAEILAALNGATNPAHNFSGVMKEQDLVDLALFVSSGTVDMDAVLNKDGTPKGNASDGKENFEKVCAACHGSKGNAINFGTVAAVEYLSGPSNTNPWQFLHRMRIGVAVWPMPSNVDNQFTDQDLANVLAYARTLPKDALASGGGQLYDKWYTVLGVQTPKEDQPLWKTQTTNTRKGTSTWTCRECHGLDYLGAAGMYATGPHKTGFPGIFNDASKSEAELAAILTGKVDPNHDFSKLMDEAAINALIHFVKQEMIPIAPSVKADGVTVDGNMDSGKKIWDKTCVKCHGDDGKKLNFKTVDSPEYVGTVAKDQPQDCMHRVYFGVPGFPMSAGIDLGLSVQDVADVCAYAQTLPPK